MRPAPVERMVSERASSRRTIRPRTWRTTITPTLSRRRTRRAPSGRVVRSASARWSPGDAWRGGFPVTWRTAFAPGAIRNRRGLTRSHATSPRPGRTRALPRTERANPARETSTRSVRRPGFRTVTTAADVPRRFTRSGLALSPMPRPAAAPGMDAAAVTRITAARARLTGRSPCRSSSPCSARQGRPGSARRSRRSCSRRRPPRRSRRSSSRGADLEPA